MTPDARAAAVLHSAAQQKPADASQVATRVKRQAGRADARAVRVTSAGEMSGRSTVSSGDRPSDPMPKESLMQDELYHNGATVGQKGAQPWHGN